MRLDTCICDKKSIDFCMDLENDHPVMMIKVIRETKMFEAPNPFAYSDSTTITFSLFGLPSKYSCQL